MFDRRCKRCYGNKGYGDVPSVPSPRRSQLWLFLEGALQAPEKAVQDSGYVALGSPALWVCGRLRHLLLV